MSDPLTTPKARCMAYVEAQRLMEKHQEEISRSIVGMLTLELPISRPDAQRIARDVVDRLSRRSA